ncbi:hypothetical protein BGZ83_002371 [Gryganskiella cystojenkinii]|nr:hypothetical protein BGZ83_002371 [Gryganskiella cystojenkinii]
MTHPTEIVETVKVTEVVEDHHKPSLKERIVDTLTGHHHEKKEKHHNTNEFADKLELIDAHPIPGASHPQNSHAFNNVVGVAHEAPHHHEGEHHHDHEHKKHASHPDTFQKYGDSVAGTDLHAAGVVVHHPVI